MKYFFRIALFIMVFFLQFSICAQSGWPDEVSELKDETERLQEQNKTLQEQLDKQRQATELLLKRIEALEAKDEALSRDVRDLKETEFEEPIDIPKLKIKGFADTGFSLEVTDSENSNTFSLGAVDFFITSELTDMVSFLTENEFEFNTDTNASDFHLDRAELKYSLSNLFNIKIGKIHIPLGYWTHTFHHGAWFQTTISNPQIYLFEDDGGSLPVHSVGIELFGTREFDAFDLEYNFDVLNGRGRTKTEVQNAKDKNDSKALNLLFGLRPHSLEGLKFGLNLYYDKIPSNPSVSTRTERIDELISGGYVTYITEKAELLGEVFNIHHDDKASNRDFDTLGFYLQGGYQIDKLKPYYRFDFIDFTNGDPYFTPDDIDIRKHTLGLRWDILTWNALKFEYSFSDRKDRDDVNLVTVNSSFTF